MMRKWLTKDVCSASFLLLLGIWWEWGATQIVVREIDNGMSADFMPKLLGYVLLALAAALLIQSLLKVHRGQAGEEEPVKMNHLVALGLLAGLFVYCTLLNKLGFIICTTLFLLGTMPFLCKPKEGKKRDAVHFLKYAVLAVVIAVLLYLVFAKAFEIGLPTLLID